MDTKADEHEMQSYFISRMYDMAPVGFEHKYRAASHFEAYIALVSLTPHCFNHADRHSYRA
jgi:hypothetical protein